MMFAMHLELARVENEFYTINATVPARCESTVLCSFTKVVLSFAGLDAFDDALPDGIPSYNEFQRTVMASENQLKVKNKDAIPGELEKIKESSKAALKTSINEAIQKAVADMVLDFQDDTLPYLDESDMAAFRKELAKVAEEYGASRIEN
jgi:hypothetical protein